MIVVDVGCAKHGGDESIPYLVDEFKPEFLYGFDPSALQEGYAIGTTRVLVRPWAAWTHGEGVRFSGEGLRGAVAEEGRPVRSFDLAAWILECPPGSDVVLKMDAEGAEYVLLPHLRDTGADKRLRLAWVEWHCPACGTGWFADDDTCGRCGYHEPGKRSGLEASMGCKMHQWNR